MKMMYGGFLFCVRGSLICCVQYGRSMFRIDLPHVQNFIRLWCICDVFPFKFYIIHIFDMWASSPQGTDLVSNAGVPMGTILYR